MAECSLKLCPTRILGTLVRGQPDIGQQAPLDARRKCLTLMATICSDPVLAKYLPQVVVGNEHVLPHRLCAAVASDPALDLLWWRKTSWITAETMVAYLETLCKNLAHVLPNRLCALLLDACQAHLHRAVLETARARNLKLVVIPAQTTLWLQPLDLFVFRSCREKMEELLVSTRCQSADGNLSQMAWLRVVNDAKQQVLIDRAHTSDFEKAGVLCQQRLMSSRVAKGLAWKEMASVPRTWPTIHQVAMLFPRKRKADFGAWLGYSESSSEQPIPSLDSKTV